MCGFAHCLCARSGIYDTPGRVFTWVFIHSAYPPEILYWEVIERISSVTWVKTRHADTKKTFDPKSNHYCSTALLLLKLVLNNPIVKYFILQIPEHANFVWYYFASVAADEKSTTIGNHHRSYYYHMNTDAPASIPVSSIFSGQTGALAKFDSVYSTSVVNSSYSATEQREQNAPRTTTTKAACSAPKPRHQKRGSRIRIVSPLLFLALLVALF